MATSNIGGGGLNGNVRPPGTSSVATNPSLAGPTPGVGGTAQSGTVSTNSGSGEGTAPASMSPGVYTTTASGEGSGVPTHMTADGWSPITNTNPLGTALGLPGTRAANGGTNLNPYVPGTAFDPAVDGKTNTGPAIYGAHGNQTLADWQTEQANTFNSNQLIGQSQYNSALQQMPYNTQINGVNPYDQFVANPATPGQASAAFQSPQNAAAWNNSGLAAQLSPSALANTNGGFAQSQPQNSQYGQNQLLFLLNTLQRYGAGGQNRFGNTFSPTFTGQGTQGGLSQASTPAASTGGVNWNQLLPILLGLSQNSQSGNGSYGNLGGGTNSGIGGPIGGY